MSNRHIPIRILEKENNKRGDLFNRLMKDLFLTLGYDHPRFNIHKSGREIDIQAEHRTEKKLAIAECKAKKETIGGDDVNKFAGALDAERRKNPHIPIEGYYISLSGFKETAIQQEEALGHRLILMDGQRVVEELIRGRIIVPPEKAAEQAGRCAAGVSAKLEHEDCFELLAHDMGWIWLVCFHSNKKKTHFALIHADGDALAREKAKVIIDADRLVKGELHNLIYLLPPRSPDNVEESIKEAHQKYLDYLESQCGDITLEGLPADQEVGSRRLNLENLFVPLHLEPSKTGEEAGKLAQTICESNRVMQLAKNPLLLTTLLLVKRWVGQLPTRRSVLYGKAIEVLLMTWNVEGHEPMDQDEAIPQLAFVAFTMMKEGIQRISLKRLKEILNLARKQMPEVLGYANYSVAQFIERVEYRSSLLMLSGYEIEDGTLYPVYEFRHLTFQEYLTARAIIEGFYPNRCDEDTLLSILGPYLTDEKWKEVIPLAAVMAGRNVQPLVQYLIKLCKKEESPDKEEAQEYFANILGQCILDEIQVTPNLFEEALEWIARKAHVEYSDIIPSLSHGRYGKVLMKVVQDTYMCADSDLPCLGDSLVEILFQWNNWKMGVVPDRHYLFKASKYLNDKNENQKAIGALMVDVISYTISSNDVYLMSSNEIKQILKDYGDNLVPLLYSDKPYLHFAACAAYCWLGVIGAWTPRYKPEILTRLLELWKDSPLYDVRSVASRAIAGLPLIERDLTSLREPDTMLLTLIYCKLSSKNFDSMIAAIIIAFYWGKPWNNEELIKKVIEIPKDILWKRNRLLLLKAFGVEKETAEDKG